MPGFHPDERLEETKAGIIKISPQHPTFGRQHISQLPVLEGIAVCLASTRNVWLKKDIQTRSKLVLRFSDTAIGRGLQSTEKHIRLLEKDPPCFRERSAESTS